MIRISRVAQRYGTSFFDAAESMQQLKQVESDLKQLADLISESKDIASVIGNPTIARESLEKIFIELSKKLKLHKLTTSLLCLLAQRRRADLIPEIIKHFTDRLHAEKNQLMVDVVARSELNAKQMKSIENALNVQTGKEIILNVSIDESILGGIIVNYGSYKLDFSIKRKLNELKHELERLG